MTDLLTLAIAKLQALPPDEQDAIATILFSFLRSAWATQLLDALRHDLSTAIH